jgi:hypothetical protein
LSFSDFAELGKAGRTDGWIKPNLWASGEPWLIHRSTNGTWWIGRSIIAASISISSRIVSAFITLFLYSTLHACEIDPVQKSSPSRLVPRLWITHCRAYKYVDIQCRTVYHTADHSCMHAWTHFFCSSLLPPIPGCDIWSRTFYTFSSMCARGTTCNMQHQTSGQKWVPTHSWSHHVLSFDFHRSRTPAVEWTKWELQEMPLVNCHAPIIQRSNPYWICSEEIQVSTHCRSIQFIMHILVSFTAI